MCSASYPPPEGAADGEGAGRDGAAEAAGAGAGVAGVEESVLAAGVDPKRSFWAGVVVMA